MERPAPTYKIKRREIVAETEGLRVSVLTLDRGEKVPWHHHSAITDTFICMQGPLKIETRDLSGHLVFTAGIVEGEDARKAGRIVIGEQLGRGGAGAIVVSAARLVDDNGH